MSMDANASAASAPGEPANQTFLTGTRARRRLLSSEGGAASQDPPGMQRVRQLHGQLTSVVATLNDKVSSVLKKQESEFLRAYRTHMYTVQKELATLRQKSDDAALQLQKNERIKHLESERDWYRSEALRLDGFVSALKADVGFMKDRMSAIMEDRAWLEQQLKQQHRKNNTLVAMAAQGAGHGAGFASSGGGVAAGRHAEHTAAPGTESSGVLNGDTSTDLDDFPFSSDDDVPSHSQRGPRQEHRLQQRSIGGLSDGGPSASISISSPSDGAPVLETPDASHPLLSSPHQPHAQAGQDERPSSAATRAAERAEATARLAQERSLMSRREREAELGAQIASLEAALAQERDAAASVRAALAAADSRTAHAEAAARNSAKQVEALRRQGAQLRAHNAALRSTRVELESFFLRCLEDVRKEVASRKMRGLTAAHGGAQAAGGAAAATAAMGDSLFGPAAPTGVKATPGKGRGALPRDSPSDAQKNISLAVAGTSATAGRFGSGGPAGAGAHPGMTSPIRRAAGGVMAAGVTGAAASSSAATAAAGAPGKTVASSPAPARAVPGASPGRPSAKEPLSTSDGEAAFAALNGPGLDNAVAAARAQHVQLSDFSARDRREVVARMLADDSVLAALHRAIFGAPDGQQVGPGSSLGPTASMEDMTQQQQQRYQLRMDASTVDPTMLSTVTENSIVDNSSYPRSVH
jgi:hypothetical protein